MQFSKQWTMNPLGLSKELFWSKFLASVALGFDSLLSLSAFVFPMQSIPIRRVGRQSPSKGSSNTLSLFISL